MESPTSLSWKKKTRDDLVPPTCHGHHQVVTPWLSQPWAQGTTSLASEATSSLFNNDYEGEEIKVFPPNPPQSSAPACEHLGFDSRLVTKQAIKMGNEVGSRLQGNAPITKLLGSCSQSFLDGRWDQPECPAVTSRVGATLWM